MGRNETGIQVYVAAAVVDETPGLSAEALAARCDLHPAALEPYIRVGALTCDATTGRFPERAVVRLRKAIRLRRDLGLNLVAVGVVLDLLDRQEAMTRELERLRAQVALGKDGPGMPAE
jgi:DNA-binding transcriptional MerR regulator